MNRLLSNRYTLMDVIGTGGMAQVFLARDEVKKRNVAIKVLREEYQADSEFVRRFDHEAIAARKMSHENIVKMYDVGNDDGMRYIVMEYVEGETLKSIIKREKRLSASTAVRYALRILAALDHAHKNNIIHRDIKPQNILVDREGVIKVTDFGIARLVNQGTGTISDTNTALGTVHYVSPEQAKGEPADAKSDLYSLGVVLYEMLTGDVPFDGETPVAVALKQVNEEPKSMRLLHKDISKGIDEVVLKALTKDPAQRYQTASEMAADLKRALKMPGGGFIYNVGEDAGSMNAIIRYIRLHGMSTLFAVLACVLLMIIVAVGAVKVSDVLYGVDVPNITGYSGEIARSMLDNYELDVYVVEAYNADVPRGEVFAQSPEANERGRKNDVVTIYVSLGQQPVALPDTLGMDYKQALSALSEYGFDQVSVDYVVYPDKPVDIVIEQIPNDGMALAGEIVALKVNSNEVTVPQLYGMTVQEAKALLEEYGLKIGAVDDGYCADYKPNTIVMQKPYDGKKVRKGTSVDVKIALGKQMIYYADYSLFVPLTMDVRIVQTSPNGLQKEAYHQMVEARRTLVLQLEGEEAGDYMIEVYFDGELVASEELEFQ